MKTNPSRTSPVPPVDPVREAEHYRNDLLNGKRYGLIIRKPLPPDAACDETLLSTTAYGYRINPPREDEPLEQKTILSSCDLDEHLIKK